MDIGPRDSDNFHSSYQLPVRATAPDVDQLHKTPERSNNLRRAVAPKRELASPPLCRQETLRSL